MLLDWLTWAVWGIGVLILILWVVETIKEFRILFSEQSEIKSDDKQGNR